MPSENTYAPSPQVLAERLNDEVVLLDIRSGLYFGLNPVGAQIWSAIESGCTLSQAQKELQDSFDAHEAALREDVATLFAELEAKKLIQRS